MGCGTSKGITLTESNEYPNNNVNVNVKVKDGFKPTTKPPNARNSLKRSLAKKKEKLKGKIRANSNASSNADNVSVNTTASEDQSSIEEGALNNPNLNVNANANNTVNNDGKIESELESASERSDAEDRIKKSFQVKKIRGKKVLPSLPAYMTDSDPGSDYGSEPENNANSPNKKKEKPKVKPREKAFKEVAISIAEEKEREKESLLAANQDNSEDDNNEIPFNLPEVVSTKSLKAFMEETKWTKEQIVETKALFEFCDIEGSGFLDRKGLNSMFKRLNVKLIGQESKQIFDSLDLDKDGKVTFKEFLMGIRWMQKGALLTIGNAADPSLPVTYSFTPSLTSAKGSNQDKKNVEGDDHETLKEIDELSQKLEVYTQYIGLLAQNGTVTASKFLKEGDPETSRNICHVLHRDSLDGLQIMLTNCHGSSEIFPKKINDRLARIERILKEGN